MKTITFQGVPVIDAANEHLLAPPYPENGFQSRDFQSEPYGSVFKGRTFDDIDRDEWKDKLEHRKQAKALASDAVKAAKMKVKLQTIPFCWIFGCTRAVETFRVMSGQKHIELSPASCGSRITGFRSRGGYGTEGMKGLVQYGACPTEGWPDNAIQRKYLTDENIAKALHYRATEWEDIGQGDFDGLATALLLGFPCPIGVDRWSHLILALDLAWTGKEWGVLILNSHGESYGDKGFAVLTESWISSRGSFDSQCLRGVTGSAA